MTVQDHALFLGRLRGMDKARVKEQLTYWLEKFDIGAWRNKRIEELSKGMAQKVQFICTVLHAPEVLILDEPMSGLDPESRERVRQSLAAWKNEGKTLLFSSHSLEDVEQLADSVLVLADGELKFFGSLSEWRDKA
jgi:ABC-2 type transport system ATP-binding protein